MYFSEIDQEIFDLDWFAVDADGCILHFASAGGALPTSVAASQEALALLVEHFGSLPETLQADAVQVAPGIKQDKGIRYDSFLEYARRGLFSFNKTDLGSRLDACYHLIARPQYHLTLADLPMGIAAIVSQTRWPFPVIGITAIDTSVIA